MGRALGVASVWFRPFVAVCAFAGLRLGEAAGLHPTAEDRTRAAAGDLMAAALRTSADSVRTRTS